MDIVVGLGETGRPLYNIIDRSIVDVYGIDLNETVGTKTSICRILNICFPFSDDFVTEVMRYQEDYAPLVTVIHSTVPIGTTAKIPGAVHSPILGRHDSMEESIMAFDKWIGGERSREVAITFRSMV